MLTRVQIHQALASYDREEAKILQTLADLEQSGSRAAYIAYKRASAMTLRQIEARRRMFSHYLA